MNQNNSNEVVILGAGGFAREIAWLMQRGFQASGSSMKLIGYCDDAPDLQEGELDGLPLLGKVERLSHPVSFFCAIGKNASRKSVTERAIALGHSPISVIDPSATIAPNVKIGAGCVVGIGSILSVGTVLGDGVIVNHHVCVGHDVTAGDFTQLCPGVCVSGGCKIGEGALLGTHASVIPLRTIGAWAIVGAGCCAMRNLDDHASIVRIR